ncbi:DUF4937 domain-containing protein [Hazenella coriacea]|uniref:Uncharacterized protein DUF4937 n=1 Tax=Hazenella coriacea TaxID=1179467 RepID=A0A4R3L9C4_9BACL|nr:DUF4937 domain-containing protein [Hazenella coriacea]TCS96423.1 uncharacterized protein DUF4937 [Hazenella coriacea]
MLIKWIVSTVSTQQKDTFHQCQRGWQEMNKAPGFIIQFGGWNLKNPEEACIVSMWENQDKYDQFMNIMHDQIYEKSGQSGTFEHLEVHLFEKWCNINGGRVEQVFVPCVQAGQTIRIADCLVKENHLEHYLMMQESVWNLGLGNAPGMVKGVFARSLTSLNRYLVLSCWRDQERYQIFAKRLLPELERWARSKEDLGSFQGKVFEIEQDWIIQSTV